jgi:DNA-binding transcriptional regulator YbjK
VLRIVARDGVAAVTHRAVAAEAGVSHRLTTYYFETKEQMLLEAFRHLSARSLERTERAAKPIAAARDRAAAMEAAIDAVTDAVLGSLRSQLGGAAAEFSLVLEIPRQPALAADYAAWQARVEALLREHALALHSDDPEADVRILQAAMRGLQLESLSRPGSPPRRAALRRVVARLLKAL